MVYFANLSQSSNDSFPTAINIAAMKIIKDNTLVNLKILRDSLNKKSKEFDKIVKIVNIVKILKIVKKWLYRVPIIAKFDTRWLNCFVLIQSNYR